MDAVNFVLPLERQYAHDGLESALSRAIVQVMTDELQASLQDLLDYGAPHLGSRTVVERFTKLDGLAVLRRPVTADVLMRVIYANWASIASERGLGFLQFVLQMLWPDQWQIIRLWHSIPFANQYPRFLNESESATRFLTSRIRIRLDNSVDRFELSELAPVLRRLVPANIVPQVVLDVPTEDMQLGAAVVMQCYQVADLSPFA
jgi:hypothetical protein